MMVLLLIRVGVRILIRLSRFDVFWGVMIVIILVGLGIERLKYGFVMGLFDLVICMYLLV